MQTRYQPIMPDLDGFISGLSRRSQELMQLTAGEQALMQAPQRARQRALQAQAQAQQGQARYSESLAQLGQMRPQARPGMQGPPAPPLDVNGMDERELLARTIHAEAAGEGYNGMLAVGSVMANRTRTGRWGNSLRDVIMAPGQFSAWNGVTGYAGGEGAIDMQNLRVGEDAYRAADAILRGGYQDPTGGATHYYNPSVATPKWGMQAGGQWNRIGNHVFGWAD